MIERKGSWQGSRSQKERLGHLGVDADLRWNKFVCSYAWLQERRICLTPIGSNGFQVELFLMQVSIFHYAFPLQLITAWLYGRRTTYGSPEQDKSKKMGKDITV